MSNQEIAAEANPLVDKLKAHSTLLVAIVLVIWLIVHFISMSFLLSKIDSVKCPCTNMKVESSGNHTSISLSEESPIDKRVREILVKEGKINAQLPGSLSVQSKP